MIISGFSDIAGNRDALSLPAGKLCRAQTGRFSWQTHRLQQFLNPCLNLIRRVFLQGIKRFSNDAAYCHARVKAGIRVLKNHSHMLAKTPQSPGGRAG